MYGVSKTVFNCVHIKILEYTWTWVMVWFVVPAWVIALLILYLAVIVAYVYLLLLRIDPYGTLNWTTVLMFV